MIESAEYDSFVDNTPSEMLEYWTREAWLSHLVRCDDRDCVVRNMSRDR